MATPLLVSFLLAAGIALGDRPEPDGEALATIAGTVVMPDGSPAAGATVESIDEPDEPPRTALADANGRFRLRGVFGSGARLHARSADGTHQATRLIPAADVRTASAKPIAWVLAPADFHEVTVVSDDRPVAGATVEVSGSLFRSRGVSGPDGKAHLPIPHREPIESIVAWHPDSGVAGARFPEGNSPRDATRLALLAPSPLTLKAVDPDGKPVRDLELGLGILTEGSEYAVVAKIEAARVRTGDDGAGVVPWAPRDRMRYVDPTPIGPDWKVDQVDLERLGDRMITIRVRRRLPVEGHLAMPEGTSPENLLVTGFGFGPGNQGDIPRARVRADGSFTLLVPALHAYVLGIVDTEWACAPWSGMILGQESWKPEEIAMTAQRATPVTVRVTRGEPRAPIADAWVEVTTPADVHWVDAEGTKRMGEAGIRSWLKTDANGEAHAGARPGPFRARIILGTWDEERAIRADAGQPVAVEFHRPWPGNLRISARLSADGQGFEPSTSLAVRAWAPLPAPRVPRTLKPEAAPDGTFRVAFDDEKIALFFSDPGRRRSGFAEPTWKDTAIDLKMEPMATYAGTLKDEDDRPLAGQALSLVLKDVDGEPLAVAKTDTAGDFRFEAAPVGVPLKLIIRDGRARSEEFSIPRGDRVFAPGEVRSDDQVTARNRNAPAATARAPLPLADRLAKVCRDAGVSGMHALVLVKGDNSQGVVTLLGRLLDDDRDKTILRYLPLVVDPAQLAGEAATLEKQGWPRPSPGQLLLAALDGDGKTLASGLFPDKNAPDSADAFLKQHATAARDALAALNASREEAGKTGRRVWIVHGGPRCGPCVLLGHWMKEHHATLEKDFVIVKVMDTIDEHAAEVVKQLPEDDGDGIPWFAITEPDGTILATSRGPLGNIGFPSTVEDLRHFRGMLDRTVRKLTADDVEGLIKSLAGKE